MKKSKRTAAVFMGLVGVLTGTSALLLAVAPAPLKPDDNASMLATAQTAPHPVMDGVFRTAAPMQAGAWQYIYVHQSGTAPRAGDHFVVSADGKVSMTQRWNNQQAAAAPVGASSIPSRCISIVLVGDFEQSAPTAAQLDRARLLTATLQHELDISGKSVLMVSGTSPAALGRNFSTDEFRAGLIR